MIILRMMLTAAAVVALLWAGPCEAQNSQGGTRIIALPGGTPSGSSSIISGATPCTGCATGGVLVNNAGVVSSDTGLTYGGNGIGIATNGPFRITNIGAGTTTLNGGINNSVTSITLASSAGFPNSGILIMDSELIIYSNIAANVVTVTNRGAYGTTANSHSNGRLVGYIEFINSANTVSTPSLMLVSDGTIYMGLINSPIGFQTIGGNGAGTLAIGPFGGTMYFNGNINMEANNINNAGSFSGGGVIATAAAPTVAAAQIGYGSTTAAAANCNVLPTPTACIVVNVAGMPRYVPYY